MARADMFGGGGNAGGHGQGSADAIIINDAAPGGRVDVPDAAFISHADILRDGQDLILQAPGGASVTVENYFALTPAPVIAAPGGAQLSPEMVRSFVQSAGQDYAAADNAADDASAVGIVKEIKGEATITRTDGTIEPVTAGAAVHQGDIVETAADGAVNIVFIDETSFAIAADSKMAIDEYVFDPASQSGTTNFSVLRGMFVFTSGLIGREDPDDVSIDTPVGSIGIRGTTIAGNLNTGNITVVDGAIVLRTPSGQEITLATQFETARFGANGALEHLGVQNAAALVNVFSGMGTVVPAFFSAIGAQPANDASGDAGDETPADGGNQATPDDGAPSVTDPAGEEQTQAPAPAPLNADLGMDVAAKHTAFESANEFADSAGSKQSSATIADAGISTISTVSASTLTVAAAAPAAVSTLVQVPLPPPLVTLPGPAPVAVNDFAPVLTSGALAFGVSESLATGAFVSGVLATDADGNALGYSLSGGGGLFSISGGRIMLSGALDYETTDTHTLTVTVNDGAFSATETYTVNVSNVDEAPVFVSGSSVSVGENLGVAITFYTAAANDPEGDSVAYSIVSGGAGFVINAAGELSLSNASAIDYEVVGGSVIMTVRATANGLYTDHVLTVNITDVNDTAPAIDLDTLTASFDNSVTFNEGTPQAIFRPNISITDPDSPITEIQIVMSGILDGAQEYMLYSGTAQFLTDRGISMTGDGTAAITLYGSALTTAAQYAEVMQYIEYINSNDNMDDSVARTVTVTALDGTHVSVSRIVTVDVVAVDDNDSALTGTGGDDTIYGDFGNDTYLITAGNDTLIDVGGINALDFTNATGSVTVNLGVGSVSAGQTGFGATYMLTFSGAFNDVYGGNHNDVLTGNAANNKLYGMDGSDTFHGSDGNDEMHGGAGSDRFVLSTDPSGNNQIDGGTGHDVYEIIAIGNPVTVTIDGATTASVVRAGGFDSLSNVEEFWLSGFGDVVEVDEAAIVTLDGRGGIDTLDFSALTSAVNVSLAAGTATGLAGLNISHSNFENIYGTSHNDTIYGDTGNNELRGGAGDDTIFGGAGNDTIIGGDGNDTINGGVGNNTIDGGNGVDILTYAAATAAVDVNMTTGVVANNGYGGADSIVSIEHVVGSDYNDTFLGRTGNILHGGLGNDIFNINSGVTNHTNMKVVGGAGTDTLRLATMGTYDLNEIDITGIEVIDGSSIATSSVTLSITAAMLAGLSSDLQISRSSSALWTIDVSAFSGANAFAVQSGSATVGGTVVLYSAGLGQTITITGSSGFTLNGLGGVDLNLNGMVASKGYIISDDIARGFGHSIAMAGDLDDDGIDDFVVTRAVQDAAAQVDTFIVYGSTLAPGASALDVMVMVADADHQMTSLAHGGVADDAVISMIKDWDGDGFNDFIIGARKGGDALKGTIEIISGEDGSTLLSLEGIDSGDGLGYSVAAVGDVNGDGRMDFVVGAPGASASYLDAGAAYLIFGGSSVTDLGSMMISDGIVMNGAVANEMMGRNVAGIGDFNNDGYDDFAMSAPGNAGVGSVRIVFGSATLTQATWTSSSMVLTGVNVDLSMPGQEQIPILAMGDINGDGIADIGIGSTAGTASLNILLGGTGHVAGTSQAIGTAATVTVTSGDVDIDIIGAGGIGDFNGDGFDDFAVAMFNDAGSTIDMYVVYGGSGLPGNISKAYLDSGTNAYHMTYDIDGMPDSSLTVTFTGIGDVDGDGYADMGIGIHTIDTDILFDTDGLGVVNDDNDGIVAVVYGTNSGSPGGAIINAGWDGTEISATSTANDQRLMGADSDDVLIQGNAAHADLVLRGGGGDDEAHIINDSFADIDMGAGHDILGFIGAASTTLDFGALIGEERIKGVDELQFMGSDQTMTLSLQSVFDLIHASDMRALSISDAGGTGNNLVIEGSAFATPTNAADLQVALGASGYTTEGTSYVFAFGTDQLFIDQAMVDGGQVQVVVA